MTDGFFGLARPIPPETQVLLARMVTVLFLVAGTGGLLIGSFTDVIVHPTLLAVTSTLALASGGLVFLISTRDEVLDRHFVGLVYLAIVVASTLVAAAQFSAGPTFVVALIVYVEVPIFAFYLLRRPAAFATVALIGVEFAVVLLLQDGYKAPVAQWCYLIGSLIAIGLIFGGLLHRGVEESMRLDRLRRFLAPQVADAVLSSGSAEVLAPHRRRSPATGSWRTSTTRCPATTRPGRPCGCRSTCARRWPNSWTAGRSGGSRSATGSVSPSGTRPSVPSASRAATTTRRSARS